jgi:hypothetical protein
MPGHFRWTAKATAAALALAEGCTREHAASTAGIGVATLYRWLNNPLFGEEVERLTVITNLSRKAQRIMLAKRMVRKLGETTKRDLLDWLKYVAQETDGQSLGPAPMPVEALQRLQPPHQR